MEMINYCFVIIISVITFVVIYVYLAYFPAGAP